MLFAVVLFGSPAVVAHAGVGPQPSDASIASTEVEWSEAASGLISFDVTITNLTSGAVVLGAELVGDSSCTIGIEPGALEPNRPPQNVSIELAADCDTARGSVLTTVRAGNAVFDVSAAEPASADTPWVQLQVFYWLLGSTILVAAAFCVAAKGKRWQPLTGLDDKWDFKDAWATNVTALGAVLTGVVGTSSVVKAILGEDGDQAIALATVGAAMAAGIAIAAPIVLSILKRGGKYTLAGVLFANAFVVSAALGELWVVAWAGSRLDKAGPTEDFAIYLAASVAAALLLGYVVVNTVAVWRVGSTPPKPAAPSEELIAAALHITYCCEADLPSPEDYLNLTKRLRDLVNAKGDSSTTPTMATSDELEPILFQQPAIQQRGIGI